ncbi:MAG TPA: ROK family protein [Acetobacteraceae bacterium]|nr:ROK family protein [Acetobacteraceae bacterium]
MNDASHPTGPLTLAIDVGGTRLKASVLATTGHMIENPDRVDTPHPSKPDAVVALLVELVKPLGAFDRISIGFPGVVRRGRVLTAPNLGTADWHGFPLTDVLAEKLGKPARMMNDATVQGLGVISGRGLECVITLGTGMGFALFDRGMPAPHLELSQHPVHKDLTYDRWIGNAALQKVGAKSWNKRVSRAIGYIETLTNYDTLAIGGGNAKRIDFDLPQRVRTVSNDAGITGGIRLWDPLLDPVFVADDAMALRDA